MADETIPLSDLPLRDAGAFDHVVGVETSSGAARRFPFPVGGAPRAYLTRASLPSSAGEGTAAYVNNDPNPNNNGLWAYRGGQWVKSADRTTEIEGRVGTMEGTVIGLGNRTTGLEQRMGGAEDAIGSVAERTVGLEDRADAFDVGMVELTQEVGGVAAASTRGLDASAHDQREHSDFAPDGPGALWGVADEEGRLLVGVGSDGLLDARLRDPFAGRDVPADDGATAIVDESGRELMRFAHDGELQAKFPRDTAPELSPDDDDIAYAVVDMDGRLLFGVRKDGKFIAELAASAQLDDPTAVYDVDGGAVYRTTIGGRAVEMGDAYGAFRAISARVSRGYLASQARPMLGSDRMVAGADGVAVPASHQLLTHLIGFGQSLSVGAQGSPLVSLTSEYPDDVLMFQGLDVRMGLSTTGEMQTLAPESLQGFEAAVARMGVSGRGQTIMESIGGAIERMAVEVVAAPQRLLLSSSGWGGAPYSQIKRGTIPYANLLTSVQRAREIAIGLGWAYWVPCIVLMHGEADAGAGPWQDYRDALLELQADLDIDIRAITGQQAAVRLYAGQSSTFFGTNTKSSLGLYHAHRESPNIVMVGPQYTLTYASDLLHMDGPGYFRMGEYFARALRSEQYGDRRWNPLMPTAATATSATVVQIQFAVPVAPLVLDDVRVADPGSFGFEVVTDAGTQAINSVAVVAPSTVRITLAAALTGANPRVRYALNGYGDPRAAGSGPRGCLRDSNPAVSEIGGELHNWCVHFEEPIA